MTGYRKIDMAAWPRREHYQYYTEKLKIECNMTVPINVKNLLDFCHESGHKFYPSIIYLVTKVLNQMENFRMFRDAEGNLCVWDQVVPNYTIFHEDDKTFSDCWTGYSDDFETFYREITEDMEKGYKKRGIKVKAGQPANFYCISCVPWLDFTGYATVVPGGQPHLFPVLTYGKFTAHDGTLTLPFSLSISHAAVDGWHISQFFQGVQDLLDTVELTVEG